MARSHPVETSYRINASKALLSLPSVAATIMICWPGPPCRSQPPRGTTPSSLSPLRPRVKEDRPGWVSFSQSRKLPLPPLLLTWIDSSRVVLFLATASLISVARLIDSIVPSLPPFPPRCGVNRLFLDRLTNEFDKTCSPRRSSLEILIHRLKWMNYLLKVIACFVFPEREMWITAGINNEINGGRKSDGK